ncbi:MAG TPA: 50S ribosomal protein L11 methyltransferase [Vicinamibacterales bacterium]|nr:50S ribosomal protein L11 methyltransferase [Vicinamibacterales bacterium]
MPYRIDLPNPPDRALDVLIQFGAIDVESVDGTLAAILPDAVSPDDVARELGVSRMHVSPAIGRDDDSVWTLSTRPVRIGSLTIVPAGISTRRGGPSGPPGALIIADRGAFGTGLHPTTALCLEAIERAATAGRIDRMLDVGTGSGILAIGAVRCGVRRAVGLDLDAAALTAAAENARLNELADRVSFARGGPDAVRGAWPLVVANIRAAELMEMAAVLARRLASGAWLVLSGIPAAVAPDVEQTYRRLGMMRVALDERGGWTALTLRPSW